MGGELWLGDALGADSMRIIRYHEAMRRILLLT